MGIISAIIFGFVAGLIARALMPGRDAAGFILTTILGIVGAVIGKFVSLAFGGTGDVTRWSWHGFLLSVAGAILVLAIYNFATRRRRALPPPV
ncbi:MAG: GlsB/YeaQ/YmgE family stress response membrane protein [Candidatus Sumerlaeaceae bacterium]